MTGLYNVKQFISMGQLQNNWLWSFRIPAPPAIGAGIANLDFLAAGVTLPEISNSKQEINYHGTKLQVPARNDWGNSISIEMQVTEDMLVYNAARRWIRSMNDMKDGTGMNRADLVSTAFAKFYAIDGVTINKTVTFFNIFPEKVSELEATNDGDDYMKATIDFSYDYFDESGII